MATIHEYRQQIDHKLDYLEMEATALENDLNQTHEQILQKQEALKKAFQHSLVTVKQKLQDYKQLTEEQRKKLIAKIDEVQINLAIGRADTEQKIREQKLKLMTSLKALETKIDEFLAEKSTELTRQMLQASDRLNAEFAALEVFLKVRSQEAKENLQSKKEKLIDQIHNFKHDLAKKRESTEQKSLQFEQEFTKGLKIIKSAFVHLKESST